MAASFDLFYAAARNRYGPALPDDYIAAEFERLSGAKPVLTDEQFREHRYADPGVGTDVKRAVATEVGKTRLGLGSVPYAMGEVASLWAKGPDWLAQGLGKLGLGDGKSDLGQQLRGLGQMSTAWGAGLREGGKEQLRRNLPAASLAGNPVDNPELLARPDYWTAATAGGIANMVPSLAGLLAGGPTGLGVMAALQETLPEYGEMRENPNMGSGERAARSAAMGVGSFLLNRLAPGIAKKAGVLGTAGTELGTEYAEELMQYGLGQQAPTAQGFAQAAREASSLLPMMAVPSLALGALTAGGNRVQEEERARVRQQLEALQTQAPATQAAQPTPAALGADATATQSTEAAGITKDAEAPSVDPESLVVNPIERTAAPEEKLRQLSALTQENLPVLSSLIEQLNAAVPGSASPALDANNVKRDEQILGKASRPSTLARKPWFGIEHVRDTLRFKTYITSPDQLAGVVDTLTKNGVQVVKFDREKFEQPNAWGWRMLPIDLRMPNGQLVEHYAVGSAMAEYSKEEGHRLYEKWRNRAFSSYTDAERAEYQRDLLRSNNGYRNAWIQDFGSLDESALRASLDKAAARFASGSTQSSPAVAGSLERQVPSLSTARNPPSPRTAASVPSRDTSTKSVTAQSPPIEIVPRAPLPEGGKPGVILLDGKRTPARFLVVEADQLLSSDQPGFPGEIQPRDRENRAASDAQLTKIFNTFDPAYLGEQPEAQGGSPIVREDGTVVSGNGRVMVLRRVHAANDRRAAAYRAHLKSLGYDVAGMRAPVLVRVPTASLGNEQAFAVAANQRQNAAMSPTETARADADILSADVLSKLQPGAALESVANMPFMRAFLGKLPITESGGLMGAGGQLALAGKKRIEGALLARAYGGNARSNELLDRALEDTSDNARAISGALLDAAPEFAHLRQAIAEGRVDPAMDLAGPLVEALETLSALRSTGGNVAQLFSQVDAFGRPAAVDEFLRSFYKPNLKQAHSRAQLREFLTDLAREAQGQGATGQMFAATRDAAALIEQARQRMDRSQMDLLSVMDSTHAYANTEGPAQSKVETRPGTTPEQVAKGNAFLGAIIAFRDRVRGARVLGDALTRDFVERGFTPLVGTVAPNGESLALLAQVYRDPRVETARLFAMKGDRIVGQTALSQRLPGGVQFPLAQFDAWANFLTAHEADGYYLLHNHPSGTARPSEADVAVTRKLNAQMKRWHFRGHVIIDHNQYGEISPDGRVQVLDLDVGGYAPGINARVPHPLLGADISSSEALASVAARLASDMDRKETVVIATASDGRVTSITAFPSELLVVSRAPVTKAMKFQLWLTAARIRRLRAASGAGGHVFAVSADPQSLRGAYESGIFTDVVDPADGRTGSTQWYRHGLAAKSLLSGTSRVMAGEMAQPTPTSAPQPLARQGAATTGANAPPPQHPAPQTIAAGGGEYTTAPFLGMPPEMQQALLGVMQLPETDARIAGERVDETVSWEQTGQEAQALLGSEFGALFNDLANRTPRTVANAARLEAFARIVNAGGRSVVEAAQQYNRTGAAEDLKRLVAAKEQLGLVLAPFMGYRTEAGRSLQILQKMQADFRDATAIFEALGSGTEQGMRDFAQRIAKAPTVEAALALTRAAYRPTLWDQFYEYWINGLLSGPWTHAVNLTSNALFNALESGTELVASMVSPNVSARGALARVSGQVAGLQLGLANAGKAFTTEEPQINPTTQVEAEKRRAIPGKMGRLVRLPGRALMAEDEFAKAIAFTGELHRLAMERAIAAHPRNPHAVFAQQLAALANDRPAQAQARKVADRLTFQTPLGPLGNIGVHWLNRSKVGRILVPFVRTPTNILKRALEYTPAGMTLQQVRDDVLGRNGKRERDMALARMAVGSSVMLGVASLVAQGLVTGAGPDDPAERALWQRTGRKPYSLRVGDQWVRYNRFEPVGMLIGVAADMAEIGAALPAKDAETVATMLMTSVANNLGDKTFLRGITDFAQAYTDPSRYMGQWAQGLAGTAIPNVAAQAARAGDPYVREARGLVDALKARVPGLRQDLPRKLDLAGQPIEASAVEPLAATRARSDPLAETMLRLGAFRGAPSRTLQIGGARYEMSGAEYEAYQAALQQARWAVLTPVANSPQFQALARSDPLAAKDYLEDQWDKIGRAARDQHLVTHPEMVRKAFAARHPPAPSQYAAGS